MAGQGMATGAAGEGAAWLGGLVAKAPWYKPFPRSASGRPRVSAGVRLGPAPRGGQGHAVSTWASPGRGGHRAFPYQHRFSTPSTCGCLWILPGGALPEWISNYS